MTQKENIKTVSPSRPKYKLSDDGIVLKILIENDFQDKRKRAFLLIFVISMWGLVTGITAFGAGTLLFLAFDMPSSDAELLIYPFIVILFWFVLTIFIILVTVFRLTFQEKIYVNRDRLDVHYCSKLFRRSKRYIAKDVQELRASPNQALMPFVGRIAFDYGASTYYVGRSLTEAEARQIVGQITQKFPGYASQEQR